MPPIPKFNKDNIIEVCFDIVKREGFEALNARRIAKELNSSVNPIFRNFKNMEELKQVIYDKIYKLYQDYMNSAISKEHPYKEMGLAYIKYAKDYPEFFKTIFMQKTVLGAEDFILADSAGNDVIEMGRKITGLDFESQKKFHIKVWIFTHGIACLVATGTICINDEEINELLENTVKEMFVGYKKIKSENEKGE